MPLSNRTLLLIVAAGVAFGASLYMKAASAQSLEPIKVEAVKIVYRCGNLYTDSPCGANQQVIEIPKDLNVIPVSPIISVYADYFTPAYYVYRPRYGRWH